jgi:effector-binding domain-containing protein
MSKTGILLLSLALAAVTAAGTAGVAQKSNADIPVGEQALKLAGTLGDFTDVKELPATQAAVATKPEGLADPAPLYRKLYTWIHKQGYVVTDAHSELFLTNAMGGDYDKMKTQIYVPVEKLTTP